jgi:hypothetical protein
MQSKFCSQTATKLQVREGVALENRASAQTFLAYFYVSVLTTLGKSSGMHDL